MEELLRNTKSLLNNWFGASHDVDEDMAISFLEKIKVEEYVERQARPKTEEIKKLNAGIRRLTKQLDLIRNQAQKAQLSGYHTGVDNDYITRIMEIINSVAINEFKEPPSHLSNKEKERWIACRELRKLLGGTVRVSINKVHHNVVDVGNRKYSICYFPADNNYRIFWPYMNFEKEQSKKDFHNVEDVVKFINERREAHVS